MSEKRTTASHDDLLLRLQESAACAYMSDLHLPVFFQKVHDAATAIPAEAYPAEAWSAALQYISGAVGGGGAAEARAQLLEFLAQSKE